MSETLLDLLRQIREADEGTDTVPLFEQLATGIEGQSATIEQTNSSLSELSGTVTELKAKNFDLLTRIPTEQPAPENIESSDEEPPPTIEGLFKEVGSDG